MKTLGILRHGEAESLALVAGAKPGSDAERALTNKGLLNSRAAALTIKQQFVPLGGLEAIYYSPFKRTTETAIAVSEVLQAEQMPVPVVETCDSLLGDNRVERLCSWLEERLEQMAQQRVLLVSHQPLVSNCLEYLLTGNKANTGLASSQPFYPTTLAVLQTEVVAAGCAELHDIQHHR